MSRPYLNYNINQLEDEFKENSNQKDLLNSLLLELNYRSTSRAKQLEVRVEHQIKAIAKLGIPKQKTASTKILESPNHVLVSPPIEQNQLSRQKINTIDDLDSPKQKSFPPATSLQPKIPISDSVLIAQDQLSSPLSAYESKNILSAWSALEVLSPQPFNKPEQLALNGDARLIASFDKKQLPWEGTGEKSKKDYKLYYHVVFGTIKLEESIQALLKFYSDKRDERPSRKGEAILASALLDKNGLLIEAPAASISSFAWGLTQALTGKLVELGDWANLEYTLTQEFDRILRRKDQDGNEIPLTLSVINQAYNWLITRFNIPAELVSKNQFAVKAFYYYKNKGTPDPLLLNSFYLNDLSTARNLVGSDKATPNLKRYLGITKPKQQFDLLKDINSLEQIIAPHLIPSGRWPGPGRHPLVLLQQVAVNLAISNLKTDGILPVNGPPGTGKTTLLRDIVASLITQRAEAMCGFNDPKEAFVASGEKISAGNAWLHLYKVDNKLKGYEMVIASSNNKAVENVSSELPGLAAVADDLSELRYFKTLSDALHEKETWGLVAAVLGNGNNRSHFTQRFWWDTNVGMQTYLAEAAGKPQWIETKHLETGKVIKRERPIIVVAEQAPASPEQALRQWHEVRQEFQLKSKETQTKLAGLTEIREALLTLPSLKEHESDLNKALSRAQQEYAASKTKHTPVAQELSSAQITKQQAETAVAIHNNSKPGLFSRILKKAASEGWNKERQILLNNLKVALQAVQRLTYEENERSKQVEECETQLWHFKAEHTIALNSFNAAQTKVSDAQRKLGNHFIDKNFWKQKRDIIHLSSPWCDQEIQRLRDDLFVSAIKVHKAFIDAAAQPIRHNLGVMMMVLSGKKMPDSKKQALVPDLWSTLFLVVPSISTTFASIERMLGNLPPEALGWLLIDEAGQALPQAAVGALMRTKRAIIVGDPIQIEPVVTLPETLTMSICRHFKINPDKFNAPEASVQTVADRTSTYIASYDDDNGSRSVGVPLVVHRRCAEPMFSISNSIAYAGLMVQAKSGVPSSIRESIGPSRWFHVQGEAQDKWCPQEGEYVIRMLQKLKKGSIQPNLYIISPFVTVAENLRRLVIQSGILFGWVENPEQWPYERIGTVHTVQGREAEAVIFVLGAPTPQQTGARNWAGTKPNLLNVAVTRAKEVIYVIGNKNLWQTAGLFKELYIKLES